MAQSIIQQRSFEFALDIIRVYRTLQDRREFVISKQLLRSGTSIGANVEESTAGQSRNDFLEKMSIASKEARETRYWLRLLRESSLAEVDVSNHLDAVDQLIRILTSIVKTTKESVVPKTQNSKLKIQN
jgi:four helix bundle protein